MMMNAKNLMALLVVAGCFILTPSKSIAAGDQAPEDELNAIEVPLYTQVNNGASNDTPFTPPESPENISPDSSSPISEPPGNQDSTQSILSERNVLNYTPSTNSGLTFDSHNTRDPDYQKPLATPSPVVVENPQLPSEPSVTYYADIPEGSEPPVTYYDDIPEGSEPPVTYYQDDTDVQVAQAIIPSSEESKKLVAKKLELEQVSFSCGQDGSTPSTIAKIKDQNEVVVILWSSTVFAEAGYDPQTRCKQVSERFEKYQKAKALIYVTAGKINGQPVLCVTSKEEGVCGEGIPVDTEGGLLYTLKPGSDAKAILEELATAIKSQDKASQKPLKE